MQSAENKTLTKKSSALFKVLSLLSVVRFYNLFAIATAQYVVVAFVLCYQNPLLILKDLNVHLMVFSTILVIASGYIINNFYDSESDRINRPIKSNIDSHVSINAQLWLSIILNVIALASSFIVNLKALFFFVFYILSIWLYSHKIKKYAIAKWLWVSMLEIMPFVAVFIIYRNYSKLIVLYACFLFLIILIRQLIKDLEKIPGDFIKDYQSIAVKFGEKTTRTIIILTSALALINIFLIIQNQDIGGIRYYFFGCAGLLSIIILAIYATSFNLYKYIHVLIKLLFAIGVFCMIIF